MMYKDFRMYDISTNFRFKFRVGGGKKRRLFKRIKRNKGKRDYSVEYESFREFDPFRDVAKVTIITLKH